ALRCEAPSPVGKGLSPAGRPLSPVGRLLSPAFSGSVPRVRRRRRGRAFEARLSLPREVFLDEQEAVGAGAADDGEEVGHRRHLLELLLDEPVEETDSDVGAVRPGASVSYAIHCDSDRDPPDCHVCPSWQRLKPDPGTLRSTSKPKRTRPLTWKRRWR